ncbi:hypothetical protein B0O99DRAFT_301341 [Bisporella sp. PMI_857]|nr:hypothetical protein B0O99DRAFT_301341 [Bisporella sp. PMI_857]
MAVCRHLPRLAAIHHYPRMRRGTYKIKHLIHPSVQTALFILAFFITRRSTTSLHLRIICRSLLP